MIEKVARAICRGDMLLLNPDATEDDIETNWCAHGSTYISNARDALEPMLKPTEVMIAVGNEALEECKPVDYIFRAMINAAMGLKREEQQPGLEGR